MKTNEQDNLEQAEKEFANEVLKENKELLENITDVVQGYVLQARSDQLYIIVKAVNTIFELAQRDMKKILGIDGSRAN